MKATKILTFVTIFALLASPAFAYNQEHLSQGGYSYNPSTHSRNANRAGVFESGYGYSRLTRNYYTSYQTYENYYPSNRYERYSYSPNKYSQPSRYRSYAIAHEHQYHPDYDVYFKNGRAYQYNHPSQQLAEKLNKIRKYHIDFDQTTRYFYDEDGSRYYYNAEGKRIYY